MRIREIAEETSPHEPGIVPARPSGDDFTGGQASSQSARLGEHCPPNVAAPVRQLEHWPSLRRHPQADERQLRSTTVFPAASGQFDRRGELVSTFRWLDRYTGFCVSVVAESDAERVLAAFGGAPDAAVRGGPRDAQAFYAEESGFLPVVRIVERGGWSVAVELFSAEGVRSPVVRRLAGLGRVVSFSLGEGGYRIVPETAVPDPAPDDPGRAAVEFVESATGVVLDDVVLKSPGLVGRVLPVLPEPEVLPSPARSEVDARVVASVSGSAEPATLPVVTDHVGAFLAEAGVAEGVLAEAVSRYGNGQDVELDDDSAVGVALRELLAEACLITGSGPAAAGGSRHDVEELRQRVAAGWAVAALLRAGPSAAVGQMLHRRRGAGWRERLAGDLERVSAAGPDALAAETAAVEARRSRSTRVPANLFKTRPEGAGRRAQAAGEARPAPGRFVRRDDEDQL
ncbi:hypothetical protein [Amycolatopsis sp. NPDC098790]|uniref:hypothetical protein n=1 Tax=Amycolatopsis sp. NPDC098790 TaxID=3363939 RepID=UPI0037F7825B